MRYVAFLINGHTVEMEEKEFKGLEGKTGLVFVPSCGEVVNLSSVSHIVPEAKARALARKKIQAGRLHDGTKVVRKFGRWVDADNPEIALSSSAYPEIHEDRVIAEEDWERIKALPAGEREKAYRALGAGMTDGMFHVKQLEGGDNGLDEAV